MDSEVYFSIAVSSEKIKFENHTIYGAFNDERKMGRFSLYDIYRKVLSLSTETRFLDLATLVQAEMLLTE